MTRFVRCSSRPGCLSRSGCLSGSGRSGRSGDDGKDDDNTETGFRRCHIAGTPFPYCFIVSDAEKSALFAVRAGIAFLAEQLGQFGVPIIAAGWLIGGGLRRSGLPGPALAAVK